MNENPVGGDAPRPMRDEVVRNRALAALEIEKKKEQDRIFKSHGERVRRMRTVDPEHKRQKHELEKGEKVSAEERVRRINILLRARVYDTKRAQELFESPEETVRVRMTRESKKDEEIEYKKEELKNWFESLLPHEKQRLYVIGRKKIDFKIKRESYPQWIVRDSDTPEVKARKDAAFEQEKVFQADQKKLADALEVVAVPMLRSTFELLNKNVDVYLASSNDDIAGGLDIVIEFKKENGEPELFHDGKPMKFVIDVTYARMWDKAKIDLERGRLSDEAYAVLKGQNKTMPRVLSNARAMKLFRTVVETLGSSMSTQTFGKDAPLPEPQKHVPRLIIGLDWNNAFSQIANWVEKGDEFDGWFKNTGLARTIARSMRNQLRGLHALTVEHGGNENTPYLQDLLKKMSGRIPGRPIGTADESLENIEDLLTFDAKSLKMWQKSRLYKAALAQIKSDAKRGGGHIRGDMAADVARKTPSPRDVLSSIRSARGEQRPAPHSPPTAGPPPVLQPQEFEPFAGGRLSEPDQSRGPQEIENGRKQKVRPGSTVPPRRVVGGGGQPGRIVEPSEDSTLAPGAPEVRQSSREPSQPVRAELSTDLREQLRKKLLALEAQELKRRLAVSGILK